MKTSTYSIKVFVLWGLILSGLGPLAAQSVNTNNRDKLLTPSPTVASLGTYGGMDIKKSTGGIGKQISLFNVKEGAIIYSPGIEYFSNGVKVNEWGGRLGIGWTENLTATIQRIVRSVPDEMATERTQLTPSQITSITQANLNYLKSVANSNANGSGKDTEYDLFSYNIFGESGSFIIKDNQPVLLNHQDTVFIEVLSTVPYSFIVTKNNGIKYFFGLNGDNEYSGNYNDNLCDEAAPYMNSVTTAWFLTKIVSPVKDTVLFNYGTLQYDFIHDYEESGYLSILNRICRTDISQGTQNCAREKWTNTKYLQSVIGKNFRVTVDYKPGLRNDLGNEKLISKINLFDKADHLVAQHEFQYDEIVSSEAVELRLQGSLPAQSYITPLKTRYFLSSYRINSVQNSTYQEYQFGYLNPSQLRHRFTFSQDVAGYYNAKPNTGFIPQDHLMNSWGSNQNVDQFKDFLSTQGFLGNRGFDGVASAIGLLNRIIYPTGGIDTIIYEPNSYTSTSEVTEPAPPIQETFVNTNVSGSDRLISSSNFTVSYGQGVQISVYSGYFGGPFENDNDGSIWWVDCQLWDVTLDQAVQLPGDPISHESISMRLFEQYNGTINLDPTHSYQFRFTLHGYRTQVDYIVQSYIKNTVTEEKPYFGQRVRQVITRSQYGPDIVRAYRYHSFNKDGNILSYNTNTSANKADVYTGGFSSKIRTVVHDEYCTGEGTGGIETADNDIYKITSNYRWGLNTLGGSPIAYSSVTELMDANESSFIASQFFISPDMTGVWILGDFIPAVPTSNSGWVNGLETYRYLGAKRSGNFEIDKVQSWEYQLAVNPYNSFDNYVVQKLFDFPNPQPGNLQDQFKAFTIVWYPMFSRWFKLDAMTETTYVVGKGGQESITQRKEFKYNEQDKLLAEEKTQNSKGEINFTKVRRPAYMVQNSLDPTGVYQSMVNNHLLDREVEIIHSNAVQQLDLQRINYYSPYTGIYVPSFIETQVLNKPVAVRERFLAYDDRGNPLSISSAGDSKSCYVWGYGGQSVIAKIENADNSTVQSILGGSAAVDAFRNLTNPTESQVLNFLAPLRSDPGLSNAIVTTRTFIPLVGLNTQQDARNIPTRFEYDDFNRLLRVRDREENILQSFEYRYKVAQ